MPAQDAAVGRKMRFTVEYTGLARRRHRKARSITTAAAVEIARLAAAS